MDDFCDCSQCPHHCGGDDEVVLPADENNVTAPSDDSKNNDDKDAIASAKKTADAKAMAVKKVKKLKKDIKALGFKLKDTDEGIRVMM
jgi:hypothetical protein